MEYTINKGSKKLDSFYLNDLDYKKIHYLNAKEKEVNNQKKDNLNCICRVLPNRIFSKKQNMWCVYNSKKEAEETINDAIKSIRNDERYNDYIKNELIKYAKTLKIVENN